MITSQQDPIEVAKRFRTLDGYGGDLDAMRRADEEHARLTAAAVRDRREKARERAIAKKHAKKGVVSPPSTDKQLSLLGDS